MASLSTKPNRKAVREALETLPDQLDDTYDEVMRRIESQNSDDRKIAQRVLGWISFAKRPLSLLELQHALATEPRAERFDEDNVMDQELITSTCAGLVFVDDESNVVRLVHYSTQEYFARHCHDLFPTAEMEISEACLTYLMYSFEAEFSAPFYDYALSHFGLHVRGRREIALQDMIVPCLWRLQSKFNTEIKRKDPSWRPVSPLAIALIFGCTTTACNIIDEGCEVNKTCLIPMPPYLSDQYPADNRSLLASRQFTSSNAINPLHFTLMNSYEDVATRLLAKTVDVDFYCWGSTAIHLAVQFASREIFCLILAKKPNINIENASGKVALQIALDCSKYDLISLLLEHGACPDAGKGCPAIFLAAEIDQPDLSYKIVLALLSNGADPNGRDEYWPLKAAQSRKDLPLMEVLLSHGAAPCLLSNDADFLRKTQISPQTLTHMLIATACVEPTEGKRYLIYDREEYLTSLQVAVAAGHESRVRMLLKSQSSKPPVEDIGRLLLIAISHGQRPVFDFLLGHYSDIDIDSTYDRQGTALQYAVRKGDKYFVVALLERGADVNKAGGEYTLDAAFRLVPLAMSVNCEDTSIFDALYSFGAFVNQDYGTSVPQLLALLKATKKEKPPTLQWLEDSGCTNEMLDPVGQDDICYMG
jgi:ankyrin repeat protein